jgi:hypothetical protein
VRVGAMCPIRPNVLWALHFQLDTLASGRTIKMLNVIDEVTRECIAIEVDHSIDADADAVVAVLDRLTAAPVYVRFDNGPEFVAHAVADWCRFAGTDSVFIDPGSPWAERVDQVVKRQVPRRAHQRLAIRQPPRTTLAHRGLAHRLQLEAAPHRPRRPHPQRVRRHVDHQQPTASRTTPGPTYRVQLTTSRRPRLGSGLLTGSEAVAPEKPKCCLPRRLLPLP